MSLLRIDNGATGATLANAGESLLGSVRFGGSNASGLFTSSRALGDQQPVAPDVHEGGSSGTQKALSAGTFAKLVEGEYIVSGGNVTTTLSGVANTTLVGAAADTGFRKSIHWITSERSAFLQSLSWTSVGRDGQPSYTAVTSSDRSSFGNDTEASTISRSVPGSLSYQTGSASVTTSNYSAKNT